MTDPSSFCTVVQYVPKEERGQPDAEVSVHSVYMDEEAAKITITELVRQGDIAWGETVEFYG